MNRGSSDSELDVKEHTLDPADPGEWESFRALAHRMVDDMLDHLASLPQLPAWQSIPDQVRQALINICAVLAEAQAGPEHIVRLTWFLTSRDEYVNDLEDIGAAYREVMGKNFPVMSVVQVVALMEAQAKVEIEATAVIP